MTLDYVLYFFAVSIGDNLGKYVILRKLCTAVCHLHLRSWFSHPSPTASMFWGPSVPIWWSLVRCTVTQQTSACLKRMLASFIDLRIEIVKIENNYWLVITCFSTIFSCLIVIYVFFSRKKKLSVYFDGPLEYYKSLEKKIDIYVYVYM